MHSILCYGLELLCTFLFYVSYHFSMQCKIICKVGFIGRITHGVKMRWLENTSGITLKVLLQGCKRNHYDCCLLGILVSDEDYLNTVSHHILCLYPAISNGLKLPRAYQAHALVSILYCIKNKQTHTHKKKKDMRINSLLHQKQTNTHTKKKDMRINSLLHQKRTNTHTHSKKKNHAKI